MNITYIIIYIFFTTHSHPLKKLLDNDGECISRGNAARDEERYSNHKTTNAKATDNRFGTIRNDMAYVIKLCYNFQIEICNLKKYLSTLCISIKENYAGRIHRENVARRTTRI